MGSAMRKAADGCSAHHSDQATSQVASAGAGQGSRIAAPRRCAGSTEAGKPGMEGVSAAAASAIAGKDTRFGSKAPPFAADTARGAPRKKGGLPKEAALKAHGMC